MRVAPTQYANRTSLAGCGKQPIGTDCRGEGSGREVLQINPSFVEKWKCLNVYKNAKDSEQFLGELRTAMGVLFEAGKLTSFAFVHRPLPRALKAALLMVSLVLMALNVAGVSGFLSSAYESRQLSVKAASHVAEANAAGEVATLERQLQAAEQNLAAGQAALIKARDDKARQRAVRAVIDAAKQDRDAATAKLTAARATQSSAEGRQIEAAGEFAAVAFIAAATRAGQDAVAHAVILIISAIPDMLAVLLLIAAGYASKPANSTRKAPTRKVARRKAAPRRRYGLNPALKVVPDEQAA